MSVHSRRICDLIAEKEAKGEVYFSFEFFPPKTEKGVQNLYNRLDRMVKFGPLFVDVTWGAGGSTSELTSEICLHAYKYSGLEPQMHLTATNMPKEKLDKALNDNKKAGMKNILALRGDPPKGEQWHQIEGGFAHASDLVSYIRQHHGDYFSIGVAGYPEKHVDCDAYENDLKYLKLKVDAGANLIVTQLFYDAKVFLKFKDDCRALGINVPILPGLMPILSYNGLVRMCGLCGTSIPKKILDDLAPIKDDDAAVQEYGIKQCAEMCKELLAAGVKGLHFYTLNMERSVREVLLLLGLINESHLHRDFPWAGARASRSNNGKQEAVRPIYWANRPRTYIARTEDWDSFPNGRWGDAGSPAFDLLGDYHLSPMYTSSEETRRKEWGHPTTEKDLINVFVGYLKGEVTRLPWNDTSLASESDVISESLKKLNVNGFLTINSQPSVNGAPSDHPVHGWGGPKGYVYQKGYIEFFTSPEKLENLKALLSKYPTLDFQAVNAKGDNCGNLAGTAAVTWGVWPGSEIKQPTVVDPFVFCNIWKDEAFALWHSQWGSLYPEESESRKFIATVASSYFLVTVIENNFITGNIFAIFDELTQSK
jgi:methylenetetrahydrofolate reductase (NADPH)